MSTYRLVHGCTRIATAEAISRSAVAGSVRLRAARAIALVGLRDPSPRGRAMERVTTLREQAAVLRTLAGSFDIQTIRDELLDIATLCEKIAKLADSPVQRLHADTDREALGIARETV